MLVLSRRTNQSLRIGEDIRITVVAVDGGSVRIGIEAPASAKVLREELYLSVAAANQAAAGGHADATVQARLATRLRGAGAADPDPGVYARGSAKTCATG